MTGRLLRKRSHRGDTKGIAYVVAIADAAKAIDVIKRNAAEPGDAIDDLGPVSDGLVQALDLPAGSFASLDRGRISDPIMPAPENRNKT